NLSHDAARFVALAHLSAIAGLCGYFVYRTTRSSLLSSAGFLLTFMHLDRVTLEPGHPQEVCGLLVAAALVMCTAARKRLARMVPLLGVVVGALAMIKINLGIYLFLAISLAMTLVAEKHTFFVFLRPFLAGLSIVMPAILMWPRLADDDWALRFWVVWTLSVLSLLLASDTDAEDRIFGVRSYLRFS